MRKFSRNWQNCQLLRRKNAEMQWKIILRGLGRIKKKETIKRRWIEEEKATGSQKVLVKNQNAMKKFPEVSAFWLFDQTPILHRFFGLALV